MHWLKNKIVTASIVYAASIFAILSVFGVWHNSVTNNAVQNYIFLIILLILLIFFLSWFYFLIFRLSGELNNNTNLESQVAEVEVEKAEITDKTEEKTENFDKDVFIEGIIPSEKKDLKDFCEIILKNLSGKLNLVQGLFYVKSGDVYEAVARYAYYSDEKPPVFKTGETIPGQAAKDKKIIIIQNIPDSYIPVVSGLGSSKPKNIIIVPVIHKDDTLGIIEVAVFTSINSNIEPALKDLGEIIGKTLIKFLK